MVNAARPDVATWQAAFGLQLRKLRIERGLSQMRLSRAAEVDHTYISAVEQGRRNPSLMIICTLARALGVSASELLEGVQPFE